MGRFKSSLICLAALTGCYWAYALIAVPLLEPQINLPTASDSPLGVGVGEQDLVKKLQQRLRMWFPADAWELNTASKILETAQGVIILRDYKNRPDGTVQIEPCSLVFFPNDDAGTERQRHEAIVMQAPQGATLRFDSAIDLRRAKFGRLTGGEINGEVTLRSGVKQPGPEDDLFLTTSDLKLTPEMIWTDQPVHMQWGANRGQGVGLHIHLIAGPPDSRGQPTLQGVRSVELDEHVEMQLHLGDQFLGGNGPAPQPGPAAGQGPISAKAPVLVASRGPFRFDAGTYAAEFNDQVVIRQPTPQGGPDELWCDRLGLEFGQSGRATVAQPNVSGASVAGPVGAEELVATNGPPNALEPAAEPLPAADAASNSATGPVAADKAARGGKLEFKRLSATGRRVSIRSPTRNLQVDCQSLVWEDATGWLYLEVDGPAPGKPATMREVILMHGESQILSPKVQVHLDRAAKQLRTAEAIGPGSLLVQRPGRAITAYWTEKLLVQPDGDLQWVSLIGGAKVASPETGSLTAEVVHLWLAEKAKAAAGEKPTPAPAGPEAALARNITPHHMEALRKVRIESAALTGRLEQLELWFDGKIPVAMALPPAVPVGPDPNGFEELPVPQTAPEGAPSDSDAGPNIIPAARRNTTGAPIPDGLGGPFAPGSAIGANRDPGQGNPNISPGAAGGLKRAPARTFDVQGRALWARISLETATPQLVDANAQGGLRVVETSTVEGRGGPMLLTGDAMEIKSAGPTGHVAILTGRPAHVEGQGLTLDGGTINLHRSDNRLWIDGPGLLSLPVSGNMAAFPQPGAPNPPPTAKPAVAETKPLEIRWQGGMRFDGQFAEFDTGVHARFDGRSLWTERVEVLLNQRINFSSAATASSVANAGAAAGGAGQNGGRDRAADGKPGLERITCPGPFSMESETYDSGRLASHERMKAANLTLNQASGTLVARGPGWIERIGPGSAMQKLPGASNAPANGAANAPAGPGLIYLKVDFQNAMRANLADRQVDCQEQVRIVYGPITAWTQIVDPDRLGPQDVWMRCDSVTVREMQNGAAKAHELDAAGDVQIEGARFDASAARLLYDDAKDWLILEGDGRIDAVLKQRGNAGESQPQVAARKINYWIKEDRVKFEDLRAVDAGTIPTSRRRP